MHGNGKVLKRSGKKSIMSHLTQLSLHSSHVDSVISIVKVTLSPVHTPNASKPAIYTLAGSEHIQVRLRLYLRKAPWQILRRSALMLEHHVAHGEPQSQRVGRSSTLR